MERKKPSDKKGKVDDGDDGNSRKKVKSQTPE
jgi:hypothetical protein